jgi:phage-related protein (TIGR01555 family)
MPKPAERDAVDLATRKAELREQLDGLVNALSGVGTERSKVAWNDWQDVGPLPKPLLEALYANNALAAIIVDSLVDDALREGFQLRRVDSSPDKDEREARAITREWERLQADENRFARGAKWGRLFGGGGILLGVRGSGSIETELVDENVSRIEFLKDVDRHQLRVVQRTVTGEPLMYEYQPPSLDGTVLGPVLVHASRLILFPGAVTTSERRAQNEGWDLSVLQACYEPLLSYEGMWANFDNMLSDGSQAVFKLSGLIQSLAEDGGSQDVRTRLQLMDMTRSVAKAIVLDAGDEQGMGKEDYQVVERAGLGGLDKVQQNYFTRIASTARTPESILLGTAPGGDSATGDLERTMWFGRVDSYRRNVIHSRLIRLVRMISRALGQKDPEDWEIVWPELEKMSPMDVATKTKMYVDSAVALMNAQAILPEEVALSLRRMAPDLAVTVNTEARVEAMELALEEVRNRELGLGMMEATAEVEAEAAPPVATGQATPTSSKRKTTSSASGGRTQG